MNPRLRRDLLRFHLTCKDRIPLYGDLYQVISARRPRSDRAEAKHVASAQATRFAQHYESSPLSENVILYESFHASSATGSPRALFEAARRDTRFDGFTHIWVVDNTDAVPSDFHEMRDVQVIRRQSADYPRRLATAGIVVNNSTFPNWYVRRPEQIYANTWHGIPLKSMFRDEKSASFAQFANSQRNFLQASHLFLASEYASEHLLGPANVLPLCLPKTWHLGTARIDRTIRHRGRSEADGARRTILYAPTWRGEMGEPESQIEDIREVIDIVARHSNGDITLLVKAHNFSRDDLTDLGDLGGATRDGGARITVESVDVRTDINDVLAGVDLLVTDYSSLLFDALAVDIPVALYVPDLEEYSAKRGLYLDPNTLPVTVCSGSEDLASAVQQPALPSSFGTAYDSARTRFFPHEDGTASERTLDVLLGAPGAPAPVTSHHKPVVAMMMGGWRRNGITSSALNLLTNIDHSRFEVVVVTDGAQLNQQAQAQLARVPPDALQVHRIGAEGFTTAERLAQAAFYGRNRFELRGDEDLMTRAMEREARRILGGTPLAASIDFSGYGRRWAWTMACAKAQLNVIFQHNDLLSERDLRFPHLQGVFESYRHFDVVAAVSEETRALNESTLGTFYGPAKSVAVRNLLDLRALEAANSSKRVTATVEGVPQQVLDLEEDESEGTRTMKVMPDWQGSGPVFITLGRCSPEKNHAMLLRAFAELIQRCPDARLTILGEGPLLDETRKLRDRLGLSDVVRLPGFASHALQLLADADCFVLSSLHEGQPMTILEALALDKPVIVTDIPGSRSALSGRYGHIAEGTGHEEFANAMEDFCRGRLEFETFDPRAYNDAALADLMRVLEVTER